MTPCIAYVALHQPCVALAVDEERRLCVVHVKYRDAKTPPPLDDDKDDDGEWNDEPAE